MPYALKKDTTKNRTKAGKHPLPFSSSQTKFSRKFEKSWKYPNELCTCYVGLDKAYDWVSRPHGNL